MNAKETNHWSCKRNIYNFVEIIITKHVSFFFGNWYVAVDHCSQKFTLTNQKSRLAWARRRRRPTYSPRTPAVSCSSWSPAPGTAWRPATPAVPGSPPPGCSPARRSSPCSCHSPGRALAACPTSRSPELWSGCAVWHSIQRTRHAKSLKFTVILPCSI